MSTSNPIPTAASARGALQAIKPTFIRGTIPVDSTGAPSLPDECFILDPIITTVTPDFDSEYALVQLQVGAWSTSLAASRDMANAAIAALEALAWRLTGFGPIQEEGPYRGVILTMERQQ